MHIFSANPVRSPIDVLLASYCIPHGRELLHRDEDFDAIQSLRSLNVSPQSACAAV